MATERRILRFSGRVQGVGFRWHVLRAAAGIEVTGFVRNLHDGRVEVVAEGEPRALEALLQAIMASPPGRVARVEQQRSEAQHDLDQFHIAR